MGVDGMPLRFTDVAGCQPRDFCVIWTRFDDAQMGQAESTLDQHGATETVGNKVLSAVTAPLAACCSTRAPARASVLLNAGKGELPVCNAAYKGGEFSAGLGGGCGVQGSGARGSGGLANLVCTLMALRAAVQQALSESLLFPFYPSPPWPTTLPDLHELQALAHQGPGRKLNVKEKDADENTPLHWAAVRGHPRATEYLVQCDSDVNYKNKDKDTPMHWACSGGNVEVIRLLLAAQADGLAR